MTGAYLGALIGQVDGRPDYKRFVPTCLRACVLSDFVFYCFFFIFLFNCFIVFFIFFLVYAQIFFQVVSVIHFMPLFFLTMNLRILYFNFLYIRYLLIRLFFPFCLNHCRILPFHVIFFSLLFIHVFSLVSSFFS